MIKIAFPAHLHFSCIDYVARAPTDQVDRVTVGKRGNHFEDSLRQTVQLKCLPPLFLVSIRRRQIPCVFIGIQSWDSFILRILECASKHIYKLRQHTAISAIWIIYWRRLVLYKITIIQMVYENDILRSNFSFIHPHVSNCEYNCFFVNCKRARISRRIPLSIYQRGHLDFFTACQVWKVNKVVFMQPKRIKSIAHLLVYVSLRCFVLDCLNSPFPRLLLHWVVNVKAVEKEANLFPLDLNLAHRTSNANIIEVLAT